MCAAAMEEEEDLIMAAVGACRSIGGNAQRMHGGRGHRPSITLAKIDLIRRILGVWKRGTGGKDSGVPLGFEETCRPH
jgi:hypothetical protein